MLASGAPLFAIFVAAWAGFENHNLYAGQILIGSFAAPVAMVVFFYEMNIPRNVSIYHLASRQTECRSHRARPRQRRLLGLRWCLNPRQR